MVVTVEVAKQPLGVIPVKVKVAVPVEDGVKSIETGVPAVIVPVTVPVMVPVAVPENPQM